MLKEEMFTFLRGEDYGGVYDRHYVLSMYDAISALGHAEIVVEREDPNEQKEYLIGQGANNGTNLEWAHKMWLTSILKLDIIRYPHSGLLVKDISDGTPERWGQSVNVNIRGAYMVAKYISETYFLGRFKLDK